MVYNPTGKETKKNRGLFFLRLRQSARIFSLLFLLCGTLHGYENNQSSMLLLGQSCALSGPAKNLGIEMRAGLQAAFTKINNEGGVNGRTIHLRSRDDGYEPDRAIKNTL